MFRLLLPLCLSLALGACGTSGTASRALSADGQQALRLAAALEAAAQADDAVLGHVIHEMDALEAALARGVPVHAEAEAEPFADEPAIALVPRPEADTVLSLMHGIHLASYRDARHVSEGWYALQGLHASLAGLQARYVTADLGPRGVYLRLLAGPFDTAEEASEACRSLQAAQNWCAVTAFDGTAVSP